MTSPSVIHPGEILHAEFMRPHGLTTDRLANDIGVSLPPVNEVVLGIRSITATDLRLGRFFSFLPQFWLNLRSVHDLPVAASDAPSRIESDIAA